MRKATLLILVSLLLLCLPLFSQEDIKKVGVTKIQKVEPSSGNQLAVKVAVARMPAMKLTDFQLKMLDELSESVKAGEIEVGRSQFAQFIKSVKAGTDHLSQSDIEALINVVLRQSYLDQMEDLRQVAEKVEHINSQKKAVRDHLDKLRGIKERGENSQKSRRIMEPVIRVYSFKRVSLATIQKPTMQLGKPRVHTPQAMALLRANEIEQEIDKWEECLAELSEQGEIASLDLQRMMQQQARMFQTISNIAKVLHDVAMASVRNMK